MADTTGHHGDGTVDSVPADPDGERTGTTTTDLWKLRGPRSIAAARPILTFFLGAFAYSWGLFAVLYATVGVETITASRLWQIPFAWGPPIAASVVVWLREENPIQWLTTLLDPRTGIRWYLLAFAVAFLYSDLGSVLAGGAGVQLGLAAPPSEIIGSFLLTMFIAGALEEVGWRGFVQPRLQERYGALSAALAIGVAWGLWHLPFVILGSAGYDQGGIGAVVGITVFGILMSVLLAWLFNGSGGSLPVVMVAHATINAGSVLEPVGEVPGWVPGSGVGLLLWIVLIVVLIAVYGRRLLAPQKPEGIVTGTAADVRSDRE